MERTGTLTISEGTARLGRKLLARKGEANPIVAAAQFLTDSGFLTNDRIEITGTEGQLGGAAVIFMDDARMVRETAAAAKKRAPVKKAAAKSGGSRKSGPSKSSKRPAKVAAKRKK